MRHKTNENHPMEKDSNYTLPFKGHFYAEKNSVCVFVCVCTHIHNLYVSNIISQANIF